jgi:hypothetical protein
MENIEQLVNTIFHRFRTPSWKRTAKHSTDRKTTSAGEAVFLSGILLGDMLCKATRLVLSALMLSWEETKNSISWDRIDSWEPEFCRAKSIWDGRKKRAISVRLLLPVSAHCTRVPVEALRTIMEHASYSVVG